MRSRRRPFAAPDTQKGTICGTHQIPHFVLSSQFCKNFNYLQSWPSGHRFGPAFALRVSMKTKRALLTALFFAPILMIFANCGSSSNSSGVSGYYISSSNNGVQQCMVSGTMQVTDPSNCRTGSQYISQNGMCYNTSGVTVSNAYCQGNVATASGGSVVCYGQYYYPTYGSQIVSCYGANSNCTGRTVYGQGGAAYLCQ